MEMTEIERLKEIVEKLRAEDGCPWDKVQTHTSLKPTVIEEAAEVICGINILDEKGDPENLKEELGDLLLQVMFHSVIAEEEGLFTFDDVAKVVSDKRESCCSAMTGTPSSSARPFKVREIWETSSWRLPKRPVADISDR